MPDDKIEREIEEILNRLDEFVPDEKAAWRPTGAAANALRAILRPFASISLSQVIMASLILIVVAFFGMRVQPIFARWVMIAAFILFFTSLSLSFFSRGAANTERRWRGQTIELDQPSPLDWLRAWFRSKRRPRS